MNQPPRIEEAVRRRISGFLPAALDKVLSSYEEFMWKAIRVDDEKIFSQYHGAAKVALGHVNLLMKLLPWANESDQKIADKELAALFAEAEAELKERIHADL